METQEPSRLATLPGYDTSPDIYETPDLTDDTSTTIHTSPRSPVEASDTSEEDEDEGYGVSRRRLYPERARSRFGATSNRVDATKVDLSDRVDGRRRGYKIRKKTADDDVDDESLDVKIARLRREIEECRAEAEENTKNEPDRGQGAHSEIEALDKLLRNVEIPATSKSRQATALDTALDDDRTNEEVSGKVAAFDARLAALEQALGISSLDAADGASLPVLPSLHVLDQQLSALTSAASLTGLDAASSRLEKLRRDAAELASTQSRIGGDSPAPNGSRPSSPDSKDVAGPLTSDDIKQLHALYQQLPNIQSLSPTIPAMLNRLRSLRTLHASAASAATDLAQVEQRQADMDKELAAWRQGLEKVEEAVKKADEDNGKNGKVVEGWVKDLETRAATLGR